MTSTSYNEGMNLERNSSRVLKPPGGGHTSIFGAVDEVKTISPRPKYDQQNSSNLNFCMNTTDPNLKVEQIKQVVETPQHQQQQQQQQKQPEQQKQQEQEQQQQPSNNGAKSVSSSADNIGKQNPTAVQSRGARVPPGGFTSGGFW